MQKRYAMGMTSGYLISFIFCNLIASHILVLSIKFENCMIVIFINKTL